MDIPISFMFKGVVGLLFMATFSLMPFHDDWEYEISPICSQDKASECQSVFLGCHSYSFAGLNPVTGAPSPSTGPTPITTAVLVNSNFPVVGLSMVYQWAINGLPMVYQVSPNGLITVSKVQADLGWWATWNTCSAISLG